MITQQSIVTIVVDDQDEAHTFYTEKLGFETRTDETFGPGARWLTVAPPDQTEVEILLQEPNPDQHGDEGARELSELVGRNPTWSFRTDDVDAAYEKLHEAGVEFPREPADRPYGREAVFEDLYGNRFSLLEPAR